MEALGKPGASSFAGIFQKGEMLWIYAQQEEN